jgi:phage-related protein
LSLAQAGDKHDAAKVLRGFGVAGVLEVVEDDAGSTYRAVYTVKFAKAVFLLHCFQKKSKRGVATPKEDMDIINTRLKIAEAFVKEYRKSKPFLLEVALRDPVILRSDDRSSSRELVFK